MMFRGFSHTDTDGITSRVIISGDATLREVKQTIYDNGKVINRYSYFIHANDTEEYIRELLIDDGYEEL